MPCPAVKKNGDVCGNNGFMFEGHCKMHFNSLMKTPVFRARYDAYVAAQEADAQRRAQEIINQRLARQATEVAAREQRRAEKETKNAALLNQCVAPTTQFILGMSLRIMNFWKQEAIPGYDCVLAYLVLRYKPVASPGLIPLLRAIVNVYIQTKDQHPDYITYTLVPPNLRNDALRNLVEAIVPYGVFTEGDIETMLRDNQDRWLIEFQNRRAAVERARVAALEAAAAAARAAVVAQQRAQLANDLVHNPVVFERDPKGGINLKAFAKDGQSVHRSSVQSATERAVHILLARFVDEDQDTLAEIVRAFNTPEKVKFVTGPGGNSDRVKEGAVMEVQNDYFNTMAFSVPYGDVLDRVWTYIRTHKENTELVIRLAQEVLEGVQQCGNGKMARLVNVLRGFDPEMDIAEMPKTMFYARIAQLKKEPLEKREALANTLFDEASIPLEERPQWLEPLLEAEDA